MHTLYIDKPMKGHNLMQALSFYADAGGKGDPMLAQELGMSDYEYAFYTAVANNDSARELMQQDTLRELAVVLFERVKANASIDWTIKESVKAKLKVIVKRTLRQFGYPPDMQKLATETVLKQAEMPANELTR